MHGGHGAARFPDQQRARRDVPGTQPLLPVPVEPAGRDGGESEGGGAQAAHTAAALDEGGVLGEVVARGGPQVVRVARAEQAQAERGRRGDAQGRVVQGGPAAALRHEALVATGIVEDADGQLTVPLERDRHAVDRQTVGVVGGAVERIHDPAVGLGSAPRPTLLGQDGVAREPGMDGVEDDGLGAAVHLGDEIGGAALVADVVPSAEAGSEERAGLECRLHGDVAEGIAHRDRGYHGRA